MKNSKGLFIVSSGVLLGALLVWRLSLSEPVDVWLATVDRGDIVSSVSNTRAGTVEACRRSSLSMPIGGVVDKLLVNEGDEVEAGQLLLELWNKDRKADVAQAEQLVDSANNEQRNACLLAEHRQREAKRVAVLREKKLTSEENLDNAVTAAQSQQQVCDAARSQLGVAKSRLKLQQAVLDRTRLHAPFAGIVAKINGEVGEYITPSPPGIPTPAAVDLIDYSCLYVAAPIDEIDASKLRLGLEAIITLDAYRDLEMQGKVRRIAPYVLDLERQARTVEVEVKIDALPENVQLLVGYSADMQLILERRLNVLRIPSESILPDNSVWLVDANHKLQRREIKTGIANWTHTELVDGLDLGQKIVRNPGQDGISEGASARILNTSTGLSGQ